MAGLEVAEFETPRYGAKCIDTYAPYPYVRRMSAATMGDVKRLARKWYNARLISVFDSKSKQTRYFSFKKGGTSRQGFKSQRWYEIDAETYERIRAAATRQA